MFEMACDDNKRIPEAAVADAIVGLVLLCRVEAVTFCNKVP